MVKGVTLARGRWDAVWVTAERERPGWEHGENRWSDADMLYVSMVRA